MDNGAEINIFVNEILILLSVARAKLMNQEDYLVTTHCTVYTIIPE